MYKKPFSDDILADARGHIRGTVVRTKLLQNLPIIVVSTFSILQKTLNFITLKIYTAKRFSIIDVVKF